VALVATLWATAVGTGLSLRPGELAAASADRNRFLRVMAISAVAVPLFVGVLTSVMSVPPGYRTGLVLVGAASAGPISLAVVRIVRADLALAVALVVVLESANLVTIPVWSSILLADTVRPPVGDIVGTIVLGVIVPLIFGLALRRRRPSSAAGWAHALDRVSALGFAVVVGLTLSRDIGAVVESWAALVPIIALATVVAAFCGGWVVGGPRRDARITAGLVSSVRANAPALAVASGTFGSTSDAAVAIVVFAIVSITLAPLVTVSLMAVARARDSPLAQADPEGR
jgi:BASS family bile acid:Na+ symporter